jgi:hypothetical protein
LGIVVCNAGQFEGCIIVRILKRVDNNFSREAVTHGIPSRSLLAFFGHRAGAMTRVAAVGVELSESGH